MALHKGNIYIYNMGGVTVPRHRAILETTKRLTWLLPNREERGRERQRNRQMSDTIDFQPGHFQLCFMPLEAASFLPLSFLLLSQNQAPFHQAPLSPVWAQNPAPMAHRAASPPTKRLEAAAATCSRGCQHWEQHLLSACPEILLEV